MLLGNSPAKVDGKGRLKIPASFRRYIDDTYGQDLYVTSIDGECVRVYPLAVYQTLMQKLRQGPRSHPAVRRFLRLLNYFGQVASMDGQGRVLIHPLVREAAGIDGEVAVLGYGDYIELWRHETIRSEIESNRLTEADEEVLASLGV